MDSETLIKFSDAIKIDLDTGCWNWQKSLTHNGYGNFNYGSDSRAHRVSYAHFNSAHPGKLFVLHRCDNRRCVNPKHLYVGTAKDNTQDMVSKGRCSEPTRGEKSARAKLTENLVREIRHRYALGGTSFAKLGKEYGLSRTTVGHAITGKTWSCVQ